MAIEVGPCSSLIYIDLPIKNGVSPIVMLVYQRVSSAFTHLDPDGGPAARHRRHRSCLAWHQQRTLALELMAIWPFLSVKAKFLDHSAAWGKSMSGMMCFMFFFPDISPPPSPSREYVFIYFHGGRLVWTCCGEVAWSLTVGGAIDLMDFEIFRGSLRTRCTLGFLKVLRCTWQNEKM